MPSAVRTTAGQFDWSGGIDSGRVTTIQSTATPNGLKVNQLAWLTNGTVRGGGITCRTGWIRRGIVRPAGELYQGGSMYTPDNAMPYLVVSINGHIYSVRVDTDYSVTDIGGVLVNPASEPTAFFCQAEKWLVIQAGDYTTLPLFWSGTAMARSIGLVGSPPGAAPYNEIPAAGPMDYYMGRLWYANGRTYSAGDIVGNATSGTVPEHLRDAVLHVTENPLAITGDGFTLPTNAGNIRGLTHTAELDTALGQGKLYIGTRSVIYAANVPLARADWITATDPIQTVAQRKYGWVGDRCIVPINGDLFYQSMDGIRSLTLAIRYFQQWGNVPISHDINRVMDFNDRELMHAASGIEFNNRVLQTILPKETASGIVFQAIASMDLDQLSSLSDRLPPVWEGIHEGLDVLQLFEADFGGLQRAFAMVVSRVTGDIEIWELTNYSRFDINADGESRVPWFIEFPAHTFGKEFELKRLNGAELYLDKIFGTVDIQVDYRTDANPCWQFWHRTQVCAARTSCETVTDPVCYPEETFREGCKMPIALPKPPLPACDTMNKRSMDVGYQFQVRISFRGWCRVRGFILHSIGEMQTPYGGLNQ